MWKPSLFERRDGFQAIFRTVNRMQSGNNLTAPVQFYRSVDRVLAGAVEASLLQRKVPLGRFVGVVDQHQAGIVLQAFSLLNHRLLVLPDELRAEESRDRREERNVVEDVPCSDDVNAARRGGDRRDRGERGEPFVAAADDFSAAVRQHEVDGGLNGQAVNAE